MGRGGNGDHMNQLIRVSGLEEDYGRDFEDQLEDDYFDFNAEQEQNQEVLEGRCDAEATVGPGMRSGAVPAVNGGMGVGGVDQQQKVLQSFMKNRIQSVYIDMRIDNCVEYIRNIKQNDAIIGKYNEGYPNQTPCAVTENFWHRLKDKKYSKRKAKVITKQLSDIER